MYYLNPQELTAMFAVPSSISDKHLKLSTAEQLKVLLWCLKNNDKAFSVEFCADALGFDADTVTESLDYWCERKVLCSTLQTTVQAVAPEKKKAVRSTVQKPTREDVARRGLEDTQIAFILHESEKKMGRMLRQNEASTLVWLYDDLGLAPSLILMIVGFSVAEGRANISFIERTAVEWANDGIDDIVAAEQRLVVMRQQRSAWNVVETAMGIEHRSPSKSELEAADLWVNHWGYTHAILREAYDTCINATSKFSIPYIKKILAEWHKAGVKVPEDIPTLTAKNETAAKPSDAYADFVNSLIMKNEED